jgi:phasin family protein
MAKTSTTTEATTNGFHDATRTLANFRMPGLDVETIVAIQRKNLEALTQANQLAVEGVRAVAQRQAEFVQQAMEQGSAIFREFTQPGAPADRVTKNVDVARQAFEQGVANARELTELATKANTDVFSVIARRVSESFDEVRLYTKKHAA